MANQYGIDLGEVYRTSEAVKSSRENRANNALLMKWKGEDRGKAEARATKLNELRGAAATGDRQAMTNLVTFDPDEGAKMIDAFSKMDENQRAQAKDSIDKAGRIAAYVLQSENPEAAYQQALQFFPQELAKTMPQQYDPQFMQMQLARSQELDQLLENPELITVGDTDRLYRQGREVERTTSNALLKAKEKARSEGGSVKSADESLIYRQAAELLGGLFDQQGNLQNLDPDTRSKVQAIATEGAKIYAASNGSITRSEAATMAARKLGIKIKDLGKGGTIDRNELLKAYGPGQ